MMISVAMATFNGERFIREQLESLARQTYKPYELVVSDDCSTDLTLQIIESYAKKSPFPVRIYRNKKNIGYGDNFLRAASLCKGDKIAFCDQDDVWFENKLEKVANIFHRYSDISVVIHSGEVVDMSLKPLRKKSPNIRKFRISPPLGSAPFDVYAGFSMVFCSKLVRIFPWENRPQSFNHLNEERKMSHDPWIYILANILGSVVFIPDTLVLHRQHSGNVCSVEALKPSKHYFNRFTKRDMKLLERAKVAQEYASFFYVPLNNLQLSAYIS